MLLKREACDDDKISYFKFACTLLFNSLDRGVSGGFVCSHLGGLLIICCFLSFGKEVSS